MNKHKRQSRAVNRRMLCQPIVPLGCGRGCDCGHDYGRAHGCACACDHGRARGMTVAVPVAVPVPMAIGGKEKGDNAGEDLPTTDTVSHGSAGWTPRVRAPADQRALPSLLTKTPPQTRWGAGLPHESGGTQLSWEHMVLSHPTCPGPGTPVSPSFYS